MAVKVLTDEQIAWEKDWVRRFDEASRSKSKDRLRPFFKLHATFTYGNDPDTTRSGREEVLDFVAKQNANTRNWEAKNKAITIDIENSRIIVTADFEAEAKGSTGFVTIHGRVVGVYHKAMGCQEEALDNSESLIASPSLLRVLLSHAIPAAARGMRRKSFIWRWIQRHRSPPTA